MVTADASGSTDTDSTPIVGYRFAFGDGTLVGPQTAATATHTYTAAGSFTVTVTVTDAGGLSSTGTASVSVTDLPPTAALKVTPVLGGAPLAETTDASGSTDPDSTPIASYVFDFGDGPVVGPQAGATAGHTYSTPGTYTVRMTVADTAGLSAWTSATVTVTIPAKTNLVGNPGFETGTSGWNATSSTVSLTRVSGGHSGSWAAQLINNGTAAAYCILNDSPNWVSKTTTGTYTASLWVRADTAGAALKLKIREYSSANILLGQGASTITLSTTWQQVSVTYVPVSPGSSFLDFQAYIASAAAGTGFYADDASIVVG